MSYSVIIPSRNIGNLTACVSAIRKAGEDCPIIVIDDGVEWPWDEVPREWGNVAAYMGTSPFIFARAVNEGIAIASNSDIVVCNDDALLQTRNGLAQLAEDAAKHPYYGVIAASVDQCGTREQVHDSNPLRAGLRVAPVMVAFICVYIPRRVIDQVGLLDERFAVNAGGPGSRGYGLEDDDYCWRVREAEMKLAVNNDVIVNHSTLPSTFRGDKEHPADVFAHEALFEKKWGKHPRRPF